MDMNNLLQYLAQSGQNRQPLANPFAMPQVPRPNPALTMPAMTPTAPVEPPMPQRPAPDRGQMDSAFQALIQRMQQQGTQAPMPQPQQAMGYRQLLPMVILGILAKLAGAKDRDIAEGAGGFMGARQQFADTQNQQKMREWEYANKQAEGNQARELQMEKLKYDKAAGDYGDEMNRYTADANYTRGRTDKIADDERNYQQALGMEGVKYKNKLASQEFKDNVKLVRDEIQALRRADITPEARATAIRKLQDHYNDPDIWKDPSLQGVAGAISYSDTGTQLKNQFLSKTMQDRIAKVALSKGLDETHLAILTKNLENYDEDRQLKIAVARARIEASNRVGTNTGGGGLSASEERQRVNSIAGSYNEIRKAALGALRTEIGSRFTSADGKREYEATDADIIAAARNSANPTMFGVNLDPLKTSKIAALVRDFDEADKSYKEALQNVTRMGTSAPSGGGVGRVGQSAPRSEIGGSTFTDGYAPANVPPPAPGPDLGVTAAMGAMAGKDSGKQNAPKTKRAEPAKKKAKPASRGKWKVEVIR